MFAAKIFDINPPVLLEYFDLYRLMMRLQIFYRLLYCNRLGKRVLQETAIYL